MVTLALEAPDAALVVTIPPHWAMAPASKDRGGAGGSVGDVEVDEGSGCDDDGVEGGGDGSGGGGEAWLDAWAEMTMAAAGQAETGSEVSAAASSAVGRAVEARAVEARAAVVAVAVVGKAAEARGGEGGGDTHKDASHQVAAKITCWHCMSQSVPTAQHPPSTYPPTHPPRG